jgi:hypothetical protein
MYRSLPLALFLSACATTSQESTNSDSTSTEQASANERAPTVDALHDSDLGIYHYTFDVDLFLPRHSLKFHLPDRKIYLYGNYEEDGEPFQALPLSEEVDYEEGYYVENPEANFSILDFNFDGHKDISVIRVSGTTNVWYDIYLFDPDTDMFTKNEQLSEVAAPEVDSVKRVINFHNNGGMAGGWYTAGVIAWQNNTPVVILEEEQTTPDGTDEVFIRTIRVRTGGEMKLSGKIRISLLDGIKEQQCLLEGEWTEFDKRPNLIYADNDKNVVKVDGRNGTCH